MTSWSVWPRRPSVPQLGPEVSEKEDSSTNDPLLLSFCESTAPTSTSATGECDSTQQVLLDARRRLCTREGVQELVGFVMWLLVAATHALQVWALWYFFWEYVCRRQSFHHDDNKSAAAAARVKTIGDFAAATGAKAAVAAAKGGSALAGSLARSANRATTGRTLTRRVAASLLWVSWISGACLLERPLLKKRLMPPPVFSVCFHAELFALAGLAMTLCTNFASFLHRPGDRLFDIGFYLVPKIGPKSKLADVSDALTGFVPVLTFFYVCVFLDRRRRCRAVTDWLRMMTVVYCFRCITSTMTSLPGPAPHCAPRSYRKGAYLPPGTWHEIATSLFSAASGGTCGDLLFSGHAAMTTVTTLLFVRQQRRHGRDVERVAKFVGCGYIFLVCLFAVASRKHYTVDLALGTLIGSLTYFRFRDSWTRDPVTIDRMDAVARYYSPAADNLRGIPDHQVDLFDDDDIKAANHLV